MLADEAAQRFARFAMIGDGDIRLEERRDHLAPTVEWFERLIRRGGIAGDVDGGKVIRLFDIDGGNAWAVNAWPRVGEFECDLVVPGPGLGGLLAIFQPDFAAACDLRPAHVDDE